MDIGFYGRILCGQRSVGTPLLVRQDLVLDFVPAMDDKLKSAKDLSARWTSVLQAPLTEGTLSCSKAPVGSLSG